MIAALVGLALADPASLAAAVRDLAAPAFAHRSGAAARLAAADPRVALPLLFAATADPDPERAKRAAGLLPDIEGKYRTLLAMAGPGCELSLDDAPLADGLKAVLAQTGVRVGVDPPDLAAVRVTVRTPGRVPVWAAVHALAAAAGLEAVGGRPFTATTPLDAPPAVVPAGLGVPAGFCGGRPAPPPWPDGPDVGPLASAFADWCKLPAGHPAARAAEARVRAAVYRLDDARRRGQPQAVELTLRPAAGPVAACASGGLQVTAVPLPPELAPTLPAGQGAVLLRLSQWSLGGWQTFGRPEFRLAGGRRVAPWPVGRRPLPGGPLVEPAGELALVVGFDDRPRRLPSLGSPPFRGEVTDALVRVSGTPGRPAELRGTAATELYATVERRLDGNRVRQVSPLPAEVRVTPGEGRTLSVEARYPLAVWPMHDSPNRRGWTGVDLAGPVQLTAAGRTLGGVSVSGRPGAVGTLARPAGGRPANTVLGVTVCSDRGATLPLTLDALRLAVGADGWVTQTLTVTAGGAGRPVAVTFAGVVAADIPFHLRDVPVLLGTGAAE